MWNLPPKNRVQYFIQHITGFRHKLIKAFRYVAQLSTCKRCETCTRSLVTLYVVAYATRTTVASIKIIAQVIATAILAITGISAFVDICNENAGSFQAIAV
jgi:hydrogenase maturation factor HypF (carbamoyltransferase family)